MKFRVDVICVNERGVETRREVMELERGSLAMETLRQSPLERDTTRGRVATNQRGSIPSSLVPDLWPAVSRQSRWNEYDRDRVRTGECAQSRMGSVSLSAARPKDLPTHGNLAQGTDQSGAMLSRNKMGLADSVREGG